MEALGLVFKEEKRFNDVPMPEKQVQRAQTSTRLEARPCNWIAIATLQTEATHGQYANVCLPMCGAHEYRASTHGHSPANFRYKSRCQASAGGCFFLGFYGAIFRALLATSKPH